MKLDIILSGIFSIITVIVSFIIGLTILFKYRKHKQNTLLYVSFTSIGIYSPWWASSLSFLISFLNNDGLKQFPSIYFIIIGVLTAPTAISWMLALDSLMERENKIRKLIIVILCIETVTVEVIYLIFSVLNPLIVGELSGPIDVHYNLVGLILFINLSMVITSITMNFSIKAIKSSKSEARLKGAIILISALVFLTCSAFDAILTLDVIGLTIVRILLLISAVLFYFGFFLPNFLKKLLLRKS